MLAGMECGDCAHRNASILASVVLFTADSPTNMRERVPSPDDASACNTFKVLIKGLLTFASVFLFSPSAKMRSNPD